MLDTHKAVRKIDPVWGQITEEAEDAVNKQPLMGGLIHSCILHHKSLDRALSYRISAKLCSNEMSMVILREVVDAAYEAAPALVDAARSALVAVYERDPACHRM